MWPLPSNPYLPHASYQEGVTRASRCWSYTAHNGAAALDGGGDLTGSRLGRGDPVDLVADLARGGFPGFNAGKASPGGHHMRQPTGKPNGRPPGPRLRFRREVLAAEALLAGALEETTEALVDLARGLRVLRIIDGNGGYRALPAERAKALVRDDRLVDAGLA